MFDIKVFILLLSKSAEKQGLVLRFSSDSQQANRVNPSLMRRRQVKASVFLIQNSYKTRSILFYLPKG